MLLASAVARGEVLAVEIDSTEILSHPSFAERGDYAVLRGRLRFCFDPASPANAAVVDLDLAPRNAEGLVEATADLIVLCPADRERGTGTALLEVSNRGGLASHAYFDGARGLDDAGDGFLMRRGLTVIWVGWQHDVPADRALRLSVPRAVGADAPIEGLVRCDWTIEEPARWLACGHRDHALYPPSAPDGPESVLTVRDGRLAERRVVPRERWRFAGDADDVPERARPAIVLEEGFEAGRIYELVYRAQDPAVVGLGLAVIRDTMAWAKHGTDCPFRVERGLAVGISQTGRFLRQFLWQGFNTDERGRQVFDGMLVHTAGAGRGSFNHRFAQPSRDAHRYSAFFYPTDLFPFSGRAQRDPVTGRRAGLLDRVRAAGHAPRVMYTNTGYEYWGRAASLLHTSLDGSADVEPLASERIYHLRGAQHFPTGLPDERARLGESASYRGNPIDLLATLRALLVALQEWVEADVAPPPNAVPRIDAGTLVPIAELGWPALEGLAAPRVIHEAYRVDYGPRWADGVITKQPPELGPAFATLVSRVDALGNEVAGVPCVETLVPLATYTPWCPRTGLAGEERELRDFWGTFTPLPRTEAERAEKGDPRPSVEELYGSREAYLAAVRAAAEELVERRLLLAEDVERALARAEALWARVHG